MNELSEKCVCPNSSNSIEFACNCGHTIVFLCKLCVITHLAEPRSHLFISLDQARALKDSNFSDKYIANVLKYMKLKGEIQQYLPSIETFKEKLHQFRMEFIDLINKQVDDKIQYLNNLEIQVIAKSEEISKNVVVSSSGIFDILEKFEKQGLRGVLDDYPQEFIILEDRVKEVIQSMIYIGNYSQPLEEFNYINEMQELHKIIEKITLENEELKKELKSNQEALSKYQQEAKNAQENLQIITPKNIKRYEYTMSYKTLTKTDKQFKANFNYHIQDIENDYDQYTVCELPDNTVLIIGYSVQNSSSSIETNIIHGTYKFNLKTFEITKLGDMITKRTSFSVIYYQNCIFTFGGLETYQEKLPKSYKYETKTNLVDNAERMELYGQEWIVLPKMKNKRQAPFCYPRDNKIYIINSSVEYFDTLKCEFYSLNELSFPNSKTFKIIEEDDFIYFLGDASLTILTSNWEQLARYDNLSSHSSYPSNTSLSFGHSFGHSSDLITVKQWKNGISLGAFLKDDLVTLYDPLSHNHKVIKQISFKDL